MKRSGFLKRNVGLKSSGFRGFKRTTGPVVKSKGKKGSKVPTTPSISLLKKKLWAITRQIIIKLYGNTCYTCGARDLVGSNLHIGHFIPSSICSAEMRYSLENLRPSCYRCNIHLSGNWPAYERHLRRDGIDVEELKARNEATKGKQFDRLWYTGMIAERTAYLAELS